MEQQNNASQKAPGTVQRNGQPQLHGSEAPASATVKAYTPHGGFDIMITLRANSGAELLPKVNKLESWLIDNEYTSTRTGTQRTQPNGAPAQAQTNGGGTKYHDVVPQNWLPSGNPQCPDCGNEMETSKYGGWFCKGRINGEYCNAQYRGERPPQSGGGSAPAASNDIDREDDFGPEEIPF